MKFDLLFYSVGFSKGDNVNRYSQSDTASRKDRSRIEQKECNILKYRDEQFKTLQEYGKTVLIALYMQFD